MTQRGRCCWPFNDAWTLCEVRLCGVTTWNLQVRGNRRENTLQQNQQVTGAYNLAAKREAVKIPQEEAVLGAGNAGSRLLLRRGHFYCCMLRSTNRYRQPLEGQIDASEEFGKHHGLRGL
jgi:hypothetical protein